MEAKKQAGRSPAAFFAEWPLSDPAMRPTRSVTGSAEAWVADEKAVAPQAQGVFRGGVSSVASRSRRSVTASAQALDHSLPGKPERSLPPLGLLSPREPLRWVRVGAPKAGRTPHQYVGTGLVPARGRPRGSPYGEGGG